MTEKSIFEIKIYECEYRHRYPRYKLNCYLFGFAESLKEAEKMINEHLHGPLYLYDNDDRLHHIRVQEYAIGHIGCNHDTFSEYIYDAEGKRIDQRLLSAVYNEETGLETFWGRDEADVRFKVGDIVEVFDGESVELAFVVAVPPNKERAKRINEGHPILDYSDDSYITMTTPDYLKSHDHVDALALFTPKFKIPAPTLNRLRRCYQEYKNQNEQ